MKYPELHRKIERVDGWLYYREAERLYELAKKCPAGGVIVEIGSWKGKSTICLAMGSREGAGNPVVAIDPHTGSPEHQKEGGGVWTFDVFRENMEKAGVEGGVRAVVKASEEALEDVQEPVALLFIDGAHEYEAVKRDFEMWAPKLMNGGWIAFHDTIGWPGPAKVVAESIFPSHEFVAVGFAHSLTYGRKVERNGWLDRVRNRFWYTMKRIYEGVHGLIYRPRVIKWLRGG